MRTLFEDFFGMLAIFMIGYMLLFMGHGMDLDRAEQMEMTE